MKIRVRSPHLDVVIQLIHQFWPDAQMDVAPGGVQVEFANDHFYRAVFNWLGDAVGCGLIFEFKIERM